MKTLLLVSIIVGVGAVIGTGCAMSVPGPAGEVGIRYTSQGAKGDVGASPDQVASISSNVLLGMGIQPLQSKPQDGGHVVTGKGAVDQVTVKIEGSGSGSKIEVIDYTGNGNWNQDFAATILMQIRNAV